MKKFLLLIILLNISSFIFAAKENYSERKEGDNLFLSSPTSTTNTTPLFTVYDGKYYSMAMNNWQSNFTNINVTNYLRAGFNPEVAQTVNVDVTLVFCIKMWKWNSQNSSFTTSFAYPRITIKNSALINTDISKEIGTYVDKNAHKVEVYFSSFISNTSPAQTLSDISKFIFISSEIDIERNYFYDGSMVTGINASSASLVPSSNYFEINWNVAKGAEYYELEYVHLNDRTESIANPLPTNNISYNFYLNSTRLIVKGNCYKIPKIFDKGYLVFRVRAIGLQGINYNIRKEGVWSLSESNTIDLTPSSNYILISSEYLPHMNWVHQITYGDFGERFEALTYLDGLSRERQSVSRNTVSNQAVVSNTYYDFFGRPVIADLPTPVVNDDGLNYRLNFNRVDNASLNGFMNDYFDDITSVNCNINGTKFSSLYGAGKYYSPSNNVIDGPNAFIPDAEQYPYSRVQYKNDLTGRVSKSSGFGKDLSTGNGHEVIYEYPSANQQELDKIFGAEVGNASHYQKLVTVDANGQTYFQYMDMAGRVVASAMAGSNPLSLDQIEGNGVQNLTTQLLPNNTQNIQPAPIASATLTYNEYISEAANFTFDYSFIPQQFHNSCMPDSKFCLDCEYQFYFKIIDECGNVKLDFSSALNNIGIGHDGDNLCSVKAPFSFTTLPQVPLSKGMYTIIKTLKINQQSIEDKWCTYLEQTDCDGSISSSFNSLYNQETFSECIKTPEETEVTITDCENYKQIMLNDVSPNGQYGQYYRDLITGSISQLNIVTNQSIHTIYSDNGLGTNKDFRHPSTAYLNSDGSVSSLNGIIIDPLTITLDQFITNFQASWANSLISYHPEYECYVNTCLTNSNSVYLSDQYDNAMLATYTFDQANLLGFLKPIKGNVINSQIITSVGNISTTVNLDPYFSTGNGLPQQYTAYTEMNNSFLNQMGSIWMLAAYEVYPHGDISLTTFTTNFSTYYNSCYNDLFWITFREMYLEYKASLKYQNQDINCNNNFIGTGLWADYIPRFGNSNMFNNFDIDPDDNISGTDLDIDGPSSPDTGTPTFENNNNNTFINQQISIGCQSSCDDYAKEWITQLSGCEQYSSLSDINKTNFKKALYDLCMGGCDISHPSGATTSPINVNTLGKDNTAININSIDGILLNYFGSNYEDNLCTSLLISDPSPYQSFDNSIAKLEGPLDICGCEAIIKAENQRTNTTLNPNNLSLEQILAINTGVSLDEANYLLCACTNSNVLTSYSNQIFVWNTNANTTLLNTNFTIPTELKCNDEVACVTCDVINSKMNDLLVTKFNNTLSPNSSNYEIIVTNYLNNNLLYNLSFDQYDNFIKKCNATVTDPFCEINPLIKEWADVLTLITYKGNLLNDVNSQVNLLTNNIVFANGNLKNLFSNNSYWSSSTSFPTYTRLTTYFGTSNNSIYIDLPLISNFTFSDIISFGIIQPSTSNCGNNYSFQVQVKYLDCGKVYSTWLNGYSNIFQVNQCIDNTTCTFNRLLCDDKSIIDKSLCYQTKLDELYSNSLDTYLDGLVDLHTNYVSQFNTACNLAFQTETLSYTGPKNIYQYTVYIYDQSGNLVKTVAPLGNDPTTFNTANVNAARITGNNPANLLSNSSPSAYPNYTYETKYKYNSYNQLIATSNPDQDGETVYFYDRYGRIVASQNPLQKAVNKYSYSLYDKIGRPIEVGQCTYLTEVPSNNTSEPKSLTIVGLSDLTTKVDDNGVTFTNWVYGCIRTEVTVTKYDLPLNSSIPAKFSNGKQENLRLRVASVYYFPSVTGTNPPPTIGYESATHYSYDIHGNVIETIQDVPNPTLILAGQDKKSTQYSFELLSGNMKKVEYQKGKNDQITHEYFYDKLFRLTEVFVSTDGGIHKSREAHYRYYDYGPLSRVELGQHKVQGMDYAYTINGWLKGINSSTLNTARDIGKDGNSIYNSSTVPNISSSIYNNKLNELVAKDEVGYSLGYFKYDYKSIAASNFEAGVFDRIPLTNTLNPFGAAIDNLYNGNISFYTTAIRGMDILGSTVRYDQLNRIKKVRNFIYSENSSFSNSWGSSSETQNYTSNYTYDKNGNLKTLNRNATSALGLVMDQFNYTLQTLNGNSTNRLDKVTDGPSNTNATSLINADIEPGQLNGNYIYDKIGQLITDNQNSTYLTWRFGDKKLQTQYNSTTFQEFIYNPFGQRILKIVKSRVNGVIQNPSLSTPWTYTYYAYDANGQVMSIYKIVDDNIKLKSNVDEQLIYGAERIGLIKPTINTAMTLPSPVEGNTYYNLLGNKRYELTNHLGNVNSVISDRKTPLLNTYIYTLNTYNTTNDGWTINSPGTITQNAGQINVVTSGSNNSISKTYSSLVIGQEYDIVVNANKGTAPNLECVITSTLSGVTTSVTYPITSGISSGYSYTATNTSATITIRATSTGSYNFSVQDVLVASHAKYSAVTMMQSDYYPFGMEMPGRVYNPQDYRFAYNGMEKDSEIKGEGNSYTTEFRQYDPRLGRWMSLDPLMSQFPWMSPYVAFDNNPILFIDPYGLESGATTGCAEDGNEGELPDADAGSEHADGKPTPQNHDWENKNVKGDDTNIIKGLERENVGGYSNVQFDNFTLNTGFICKNSENYEKDKYYDNSVFETAYKATTIKLNGTLLPENSIYKEKVTNTFIIRDNYIYHKQIIERTTHFFDYKNGLYLYSETEATTIEEKQYFDGNYNNNEDIILDPNKFYSKVKTVRSPNKIDNVKITQEMANLVDQIVKQKKYFDQVNEMRKEWNKETQDVYEATRKYEGVGKSIYPVNWKRSR